MDTKKVISTACSTNTPPLRCHNPALPITARNAERSAPMACPLGSKSGTPHTANSRHKKPNKLITQNSPESPNCPTITGEITKDKAKDKPMDMPIMAMARVRTSGRVASATQALMAADTAPPPSQLRPPITPPTACANAATTRSEEHTSELQ